MKRKHTLIFVAITVFALLLGGLVTAIQAYRGTYLGEEVSPDGMYSLRYYQSFNPFQLSWSMPGDAACTPEWVRLYSKEGEKLNELYTTNCQREMAPLWSDKKVFLPDGDTVWTIPDSNLN